MRSFLRLAALCAASMALVVPAAIAAKPETTGKPADPGSSGKPADPGSSGTAGQGQNQTTAGTTRQPEHAGQPGGNQQAPGQLKDKGILPDTLPGVPLPNPEPQPNPAHAAETELGETVAASATRGTVTVKLPGTEEFVDLPETGPLPVGTSIDATEGSVEIGSEAAGGVEQHAFVTGSVFRIDQAAADGGATDLVLEGGEFDDCKKVAYKGKKAKKGKKARAAAKRKKSRRGKARVARGLWASGKGKFRTRGSHAVASVRGTEWITVDRCHSTTVKVKHGVVDVADELTGKTVTLRAGDRHVASKLGSR